MKNFTILLTLVTTILSCNTNDDDSMDSESLELQAQYEAIVNLTLETSCIDASTWEFTAIGSRACGGPDGFIPYPTTIDTAAFLKQVATYTKADAAFNEKWEVIGPCNVPSQPSGVACENGNAVLLYE